MAFLKVGGYTDATQISGTQWRKMVSTNISSLTGRIGFCCSSAGTPTRPFGERTATDQRGASVGVF
ncbi:MAG: hypothetical protein LBT09_04140 [Planctomycetaceae bacterium]|nr:hypothetical protein [Planctomycetaceae bacterium]